jgi:acyl-CoA synthetase (AMP-forming)/AMP-acid ligase II
VVSLHPDSTLTKEDLIKFCGSKIAGYKKPRYVEFVEELPKAEDGAVDREKVKAAYR